MQDQLTTWLYEYTTLLGSLAVVSLLLLLVSVFIAPWLIARLPADYLLRSSEPRVGSHGMRFLIGTVRNIIALFMLLLGILMLVAPGPGIIMLLLAVSMAQVRGKQRLIQRIAKQEKVFQSLNWMRKHRKKPPFIHPDT
jgi:flagellar biosynthesis protein FlhB